MMSVSVALLHTWKTPCWANSPPPVLCLVPAGGAAERARADRADWFRRVDDHGWHAWAEGGCGRHDPPAGRF